MWTHIGPMLASSVFVSLYAPCLVDAEGHVFLVSYILSDPSNRFPLLQDFMSTEGMNLRGEF